MASTLKNLFYFQFSESHSNIFLIKIWLIVKPAENSVQTLSASCHFKILDIRMTKQFAVIGNPIEQSRSPELHHAFAQKQVLT